MVIFESNNINKVLREHKKYFDKKKAHVNGIRLKIENNNMHIITTNYYILIKEKIKNVKIYNNIEVTINAKTINELIKYKYENIKLIQENNNYYFMLDNDRKINCSIIEDKYINYDYLIDKIKKENNINVIVNKKEFLNRIKKEKSVIILDTKDFKITFDVKYMYDLLTYINKENIKLKLKSSIATCYIEDNNKEILIAPIKI